METAYLLLTFVRNDGRQLQMGCGCPIKVAKISGIESPDYSVHTASSAVEPGSYVAGKKVEEREISVTSSLSRSPFRSKKLRPLL